MNLKIVPDSGLVIVMIDVLPHKLLYLAKAGSHLFGTNTPHSDLDVKGIFLPSPESLILQNAPQQFTHNTNKSSSGLKNSSMDVDITVWSLQFFVKLLAKGDINAVSLLFSHSNPEAILPGSEANFVTRLAKLDPRKILSNRLSGMMGFAYSQAIKYSDKGKHLRVLQTALEHLHAAKTGLVADVADTILLDIADPKLAYAEPNEHGAMQLVLLEKRFDYTARAAWALKPLHELEIGYGKRARFAQQTGVDFKAFSHSLRVLEEIRQLHTLGQIKYPHEANFAALMRDVKLGRYPMPALMDLLDAKLEVTRQAERSSVLSETVDEAHAQEFVLHTYRPTRL